MSDNLRGALWILLSSVFAVGMNVAIRELAGHIRPEETVLWRNLVGLVLIVPWLVGEARRQRRPFTTGHIWLHLLRGLLGAAALEIGFYSVSHLPLATVTILFFTAPLFVTMLAPLMVGERVGWRRWTATLVGFAGAAVVARPTPDAFDAAYLLPVFSSFIFAITLLLGKRISRAEAPLNLMFYGALFTALFSLPPAIPVWQTPDVFEFAMLLLVGLFGTARAYCEIKGFAGGEASFVAPFQYVRLLMAGTAGYWLFSEMVDGYDVVGAAIILASTLYIAQREARLKKPPVGLAA